MPSFVNSNARSTTLEHSGSVWFSDGNIILITGSTAFKVHRGQLSRHSEVFATLFCLPPVADDSLYDGCQYVELHDSPRDMLHFLEALYDGLYLKEHHAADFLVLASVLRLSTKYAVDRLHQHCLSYLETEWPSTLRLWDERERLAVDRNNVYNPRESYAHPILVINLCLELGLTSLLPSALYDLSRYGPSKITGGTSTDERFKDSPVASLSDDMVINVLQGREHAQKYVTHYIATELCKRRPSVSCTNADSQRSHLCYESFYFIMLNIIRCVGGLAIGRDADPLFTVLQSIEMTNRADFTDGQRKLSLGLCQECKLDLALAASNAREEVWRRIPMWFGLVEAEEEELVLDIDVVFTDLEVLYAEEEEEDVTYES